MTRAKDRGTHSAILHFPKCGHCNADAIALNGAIAKCGQCGSEYGESHPTYQAVKAFISGFKRPNLKGREDAPLFREVSRERVEKERSEAMSLTKELGQQMLELLQRHQEAVGKAVWASTTRDEESSGANGHIAAVSLIPKSAIESADESLRGHYLLPAALAILQQIQNRVREIKAPEPGDEAVSVKTTQPIFFQERYQDELLLQNSTMTILVSCGEPNDKGEIPFLTEVQIKVGKVGDLAKAASNSK